MVLGEVSVEWSAFVSCSFFSGMLGFLLFFVVAFSSIVHCTFCWCILCTIGCILCLCFCRSMDLSVCVGHVSGCQ